MADEDLAPRWGVMGTGGRAHAFARALGASLVAVGSRSTHRARGFAKTWGLSSGHGSYADLALDPAVEAVYVATPHPWHHPHALLALEAGKHVLVDAPLAVNALQVAQMVEAARASGRLLMECSALRHLPVHRLVRDLVGQGAIGRVCSVHAEFGLDVPYDPGHRFFDPDRGGGALLDLGVHQLSLASWYLGEMTVVGAARQLAPDRMVDTRTTVLVHGEEGATATLTCALHSEPANRAVIAGTEGRVEIDRFWDATEAVLHRRGREPEHLHRPFTGGAQRFAASEAARCLRAGLSESPAMPWAESRALVETVDRVRDAGVLLSGPELTAVSSG